MKRAPPWKVGQFVRHEIGVKARNPDSFALTCAEGGRSRCHLPDVLVHLRWRVVSLAQPVGVMKATEGHQYQVTRGPSTGLDKATRQNVSKATSMESKSQ